MSEEKPTAFLTDENNKIIMVTGYSYISLINKIIEIIGDKDLSSKAIKTIVKEAAMNDAVQKGNNGKTLLMFMSSSCRMCREGEELVKKNIDLMRKKIDIITIRPDFDTKQDFDINFEEDPQQIYFNIFAYTQEIDAAMRKYPMFIIIDKDYSVVKLFKDINEMLDYVDAL